MLRPMPLVDFDPRNKQHLEAFAMLHYHGRQHPTLRFELSEMYVDVPSLMIDRILDMVLPVEMRSKQIINLEGM